MTPEGAKKHLAVIQAFAEGKAIEIFGTFNGQKMWIPCNFPEFKTNCDYRVKPVPRTLYLVTWRNRAHTYEARQVYHDEHAARGHVDDLERAGAHITDVKMSVFKEVLDDEESA